MLHDLEDPQISESIAASDAAVPSFRQRGARWLRAHWKPLAATVLGVGLIALSRKHVRPLLAAGVDQLAPIARDALARARA